MMSIWEIGSTRKKESVKCFISTKNFTRTTLRSVGRVAQSVQRLATGWTVRGSNRGGVEIFRTCPDRPWGPPSLLYNGYRVFPGVKSGRGVRLTPLPFQCRGQERVELYLYSPHGPYGLYRASVPVQGCTLPLSFTLRSKTLLHDDRPVSNRLSRRGVSIF